MEKRQQEIGGRASAAAPRRLLSISTDRKVFEEGSAVRVRQIGYAKDWDEVDIVVLSGRGLKEQVVAPNLFIYPTSSFFKFFRHLGAVRLGRFIIEKRGITDITCQDPFFTAMAGVSLKKETVAAGRDVRLEIQLHTDIGSPNYVRTFGNKARKALALSYLPKADSVRVVSERIKKYLVETLGISVSKITVRPIVVDTDKIKNAPVMAGADLHKKYPQFEKIVLMASRLEPEKDIESAIRAWSEVVNTPAAAPKLPKAGLVIVGTGSCEAKLKKLAAKLDLDASVVFEKWADQATLFSYYKTADLFLNTSLFEGYGMTLVEAHAAGCPIVSTDVGVAPEVGAKIVGGPDKKAFIQAIAQAITDMLK
jgi:glycosyltransferase involved in cell wall biosynthesis